jgi:hypothetical protein
LVIKKICQSCLTLPGSLVVDAFFAAMSTPRFP